MNHELQIILGITVAVATALVGGLVAHRLKLSPIVGYLLAGIVVGPFTGGFTSDREQIAVLAEVGVIFLMFALGIEFSLKELARIRNAAVFGTSLQLALIIALGFGFGRVLGWTWQQSLFFGGVIAVSSTMVILKTLLGRGEVNSTHGRLLLAMLIVQDLAVVVLILLLPRVVQGNSDALAVAFLLAKAALFIGANLFLGEFVVPKLMAHVAELRSPELFLLCAVVLALGTATVSALLGLSPALGAFMGGLMLTETEFDHRVVSEMVPMRDLFATLFFVSVGMLINVRFVLQNAPMVVGMAVFIMLAKIVATSFALIWFRVGGKTLAFASLGMISIGEFNYVLAHVGLREKIITDDLYNLILTSSLLTIIFTPLAFYIAPRVGRALTGVSWLHRVLEARLETKIETDALQNHAIVVGYGRVGKRMTRGLRQAGLKVIVIDQELNLVRELTDAGQRAILGDASYESVLATANPENARVIVVALPDFGATRAVVHRARRMNENVLIVARAQRTEDDAKLRDAGATAVVVPEIAGSLMLLDETLTLMNLRSDDLGMATARVSPVENANFPRS